MEAMPPQLLSLAGLTWVPLQVELREAVLASPGPGGQPEFRLQHTRSLQPPDSAGEAPSPGRHLLPASVGCNRLACAVCSARHCKLAGWLAGSHSHQGSAHRETHLFCAAPEQPTLLAGG